MPTSGIGLGTGKPEKYLPHLHVSIPIPLINGYHVGTPWDPLLEGVHGG